MNVNLLEVEFENQNFYFFIVAERQLSQYIFFNDTFITRTKYDSFTSMFHAGKF